ncbi:MAG: EpsI family protein [Candidatus Omnitrophica bacterium]|nr:EpsI family protein [Candidatus Omnitrophota bacterium]
MGTEKTKYLVVIIILALSSFWVTFVLNRKGEVSQGSSKRIEIPYSLGEWNGKDADISPEELEEIYRILGTDKVILRNYVNDDGSIIQLYVVYSQKDRTSFHPPEYCYIGGGNAELIGKGLVQLSLYDSKLAANRLIFQTPKGTQQVIYWYAAGKKMYASYNKQQIRLVLDMLKGGEFQGLMVRLSSLSREDKQADDLVHFQNFANEIMPYLRK